MSALADGVEAPESSLSSVFTLFEKIQPILMDKNRNI